MLAIALGYSFGAQNFFKDKNNPQIIGNHAVKSVILRAAIVSDSHNKNDLLAKALSQAQGMGVNFVIGLGDWTDVGTEKELADSKAVFDKSKLPYFVTAGDHDLWDSRNRAEEALVNYRRVFGDSSREFERDQIQFVILDNSDIYKGISAKDWQLLSQSLGKCARGPVSGFLPVSARSGLKSSGRIESSADLRAAGSPSTTATPRLCFVFFHKTPFHPQSKHVMGEDSAEVSQQAANLLSLLESVRVDGIFSGDLHFFAKYQSPSASVKITTVGAVTSERNFQGPRFAVLSVFDDYTWEVEDVEIR